MITRRNIIPGNLLLVLIAAAFSFNSFGFIFTFVIQQGMIREKSFEQMEKSRHPEKLITLSLSPADYENEKVIQRINDKEIRYEGKMYDIKSIERTSEAVIIRCIHDEKEDRLEKEFANSMDKNINLKGLNNKQLQFNQQIHYVEFSGKCRISSPLNKNIFLSFLTAYYPQANSKVITPPPETLFL